MSVPSQAQLILCISILVSWLIPAESVARTWYVKVDGTGDVPRLQDAVDLAVAGDTVLVGPGRYTWNDQGPGNDMDHGLVVLWANRPTGVTYISEEGPEKTILDAQFQGRVVFANGSSTATPVTFTLSGFTITRGRAPVVPFRPYTEGGGLVLHLVYPIIENCIFIDNEAEAGGGVFAGGVSSIQFRNCQFINNRATFGAGMLLLHSYKESTLEDCSFRGNTASPNGFGVGGFGGGLYCLNNKYRVERCTFWNNDAEVTGAAFYSVNSKSGILRTNTFRGNATTNSSARAIVDHAVDPDLTEGRSTIEFHNNLIAFNGSPQAMVVEPAVAMSVACNDIYGNVGGNWTGDLASYLDTDGNLQVDPLFCEDDGGRTWTVATISPVRGENNACGEDIGLVLDGGPQCGGLGIGEGQESPESEPDATVAGFRMYGAAPNPFLPEDGGSTTFAFDLPQRGHVRVDVYDLAGRRVRQLQSGVISAGRRFVSWSGHDEAGRPVAAGVYLVRVRTEQREGTGRVVVVR